MRHPTFFVSLPFCLILTVFCANLYVGSDFMIKTTVLIDGMDCKLCASLVNKAIKSNFKTRKVSSSCVKKTSVIKSEHSLDKDKIKKVIVDLGFDVKSIDEKEIKGLFRK